jgi:2-polyprenyl-6-methoxyphenol hydroxylase-like FAD-dependent oxidoreductase
MVSVRILYLSDGITASRLRQLSTDPGDAVPSNHTAGATSETPVLIVGGGPVGLAMALLLDRLGVPFVVLERSPSTTDHPKSRGCWIRTMELFRQWGIEERIRARGLANSTDIFVYVESIAGREIGRTRPEPLSDRTPAWKCMVAQDAVEEELLAIAGQSKVGQVLYSTECLGFEQDADGITVSSRSMKDSSERRWRCQYLIGADGAGSPTRRALGIEFNGPPVLGVMENIYWRGDLSHLPVANQAAGFRVVSPDRRVPVSTILNTNGRDRWLTVTQVGVQQDDRVHPWTHEEAIALIRKQTGVPDLDVEIINRSVWRVSRQVARSFCSGRAFLVGDAAHRFPPTGGFGLNSGVQDAHNLAWKLAYVLKGLAGPELLDTYDLERRPVAESNADFSLGNRFRYQHTEAAIRSGNGDRIRFWVDDTDNHLHSIGQSLGFSYEEGALVPDGTVRKALNSRHYDPTDRPGARFPHLWLDAARKQSTLDWFDKEFVLVAGPLGQRWADAAAAASRELQIPIQLRYLPQACQADGIRIGMRGAALVRPDGHVAWRMPWIPEHPEAELAQAAARVLGRVPA